MVLTKLPAQPDALIGGNYLDGLNDLVTTLRGLVVDPANV
jgi:hypothetical protein